MKLFKSFVLNSNQLIYLHSLLKTFFFRAYVKEVVAFTFLALWLILVHTFGPRKDKSYFPVLVLRREKNAPKIYFFNIMVVCELFHLIEVTSFLEVFGRYYRRFNHVKIKSIIAAFGRQKASVGGNHCAAVVGRVNN